MAISTLTVCSFFCLFRRHKYVSFLFCILKEGRNMRKGIVAGAGYRNGINNIPSLSHRYVRHGMHLWVSYIAFGRNIILSLCGREKVCNEDGDWEQNREFLEISLLGLAWICGSVA